MEWMNSNTGILTLTGIFISIGIFLLLRWQADEQGKDARKLTVQKEIHNQWMEFWRTGYRSGLLTDKQFLDALHKFFHVGSGLDVKTRVRKDFPSGFNVGSFKPDH